MAAEARYRGLPGHRPVMVGYDTRPRHGDASETRVKEQTCCVIVCLCGVDIRMPSWPEAGREFEVHLILSDPKSKGLAVGGEGDAEE